MPEDKKSLRAKALEVHRRLLQAYGEPQPRDRDPVDTLVSAIISQNTNDELRDRAYRRLRDRFPTWEQVRDAPAHAIAEAIRVAGLSRQKAPRIKQALQRITEERGELSLDFLREMPVAEARQWLTSLDGVGPKTAAIVLLFALGMPAFPVDTHVHRVSRRIGLIGNNTSREKAHDDLESLLPEALYYPFHINLIRHGREVCSARNPKCEICVVNDLCEYYSAARQHIPF
ncbi:MAG: endonuclease III [Chloroflexi bacterium]|nr:MAG: endonuclease III [Chloroflexota bacterium]